MATKRCSGCSINWPVTKEYAECPICGDPTSYMTGPDSITAGEAKSLAANARFEQFLRNESEDDRRAREARAEDIERPLRFRDHVQIIEGPLKNATAVVTDRPSIPADLEHEIDRVQIRYVVEKKTYYEWLPVDVLKRWSPPEQPESD